jgi:aminoglycoside phosphotransferase (APT) family kinase protein
MRMHEDELELDEALVQRLLAAEFPEWAELPLRRIEPSGTVNAIFRLGDGLSVRLPRRQGPTRPGSRELDWLPTLAPQLPVEVPTPVAQGRPTEDYPWFWEIHTWLEGETVAVADIDAIRAVGDLAGLVAALQRIDPAGAPAGRGIPLAERGQEMTRWFERFDGDPRAREEWERRHRRRAALARPTRLAPRRPRRPQLARARRSHQRRHRLGVHGCR